MTHASVFSGIGGPEVAATMLGWINLFHCEINPFGRAILDYWYPNSESYEDITKTDFSKWRGRVNVLTGGFPCQPFSYSGQRRGENDDRYLWPYMFRCIDQIRPDWVVCENVNGILTMVEQGEVSKMASEGSLFDEDNVVRGYQLRETFTIERICNDLESHGYSVQAVLIPACAVGAPHRRDRVFIIGHRNDAANSRSGRQSASELKGEREGQTIQQQSRVKPFDGIERPCVSQTFADSAIGGEEASRTGAGVEGCGSNRDKQSSERRATSEWSDGFYAVLRHLANPCGNNIQDIGRIRGGLGETDCRRSAGRCMYGGLQDVQGEQHISQPGERWKDFPTVSPIHGGNDGFPFDVDDLTISFAKWRTESLKAYGNAIVPQVMYEIFLTIQNIEDQLNI